MRSGMAGKRQIDDISSWRHNGGRGNVINVSIRERHGACSARTRYLFVVQSGLDMQYVAVMCMS